MALRMWEIKEFKYTNRANKENQKQRDQVPEEVSP